MTAKPEEKEPTDLFELAENRTRAVLTAIRRWGQLRKDGQHPYSKEQVEAMGKIIDAAWERAKQDFEGAAFALPGKP